MNPRVFAAVALAAAVLIPGAAADWPAYRHDAQRTGASAESLAAPLHLHWTFHPAQPPRPAWPAPAIMDAYKKKARRGKFKNILQFDRVFHPVAADGKVYFGSSADHTITCLDAATGKTVWVHFTEGPVRMAPAVSEGRLVAGSDDGRAHCLDAATGKLRWRTRIGPEDARLPGNEQMVSRWPLRSGVVVRDGVVYTAAGVFPKREGCYLAALRADTGAEVWKTRIDQVAQGYLVASDNSLVVPAGEGHAASYAYADGKRLAGVAGPRGTTGMALKTVLLFGPSIYGRRLDVVRADATDKRIKTVTANAVAADFRNVYAITKTELYAIARGQVEEESDKPRGEWRHKSRHTNEIALAGDLVVAAGDGEVALYSKEGGTLRWTGKVDGDAYGLAVDGGRLFVTTDTGALHCFGPDKRAAAVVKAPAARAETGDAWAAIYNVADRIAKVAPKGKGLCLDLGCGDGLLARVIAAQTELTVIGVTDDPKAADAARRACAAAGLYGSRIVIHEAPLDRLPYPKWMFNLVVSSRALRTRKPLPSAKEAHRVLRPAGGVLCVGDPATTTVVRRGALEGSGAWTHQYGNAANTTCSEDKVVNRPVRMQWYGRPGPRLMFDRHSFAHAGLCVNGRMFTTGERTVFASDAYNGTPLWTLDIPELDPRVNIPRDSGFMVADDTRVFVAAGDRCLSIRAEDGVRLAPFTLAQLGDDPGLEWGYLAVNGDLLFGSAVRRGQFYRDGRGPMYKRDTAKVTGECLFATDRKTRDVRWRHDGLVIHSSITIGGGRVYFYEHRGDAAAGSGRRLLSEDRDLALVALDQETGEKLWELDPVDFPGPSPELFVQYKDEVLVVVRTTGAYNIYAYNAATGDKIWERHHGPTKWHHGAFRRKTLIFGDTVLQEPVAYDLKTGKPKWNMWDRRKCGSLSASAHYIFGRHGTHTLFDIAAFEGVKDASRSEALTGVTRPGCWINIITGGGMILAPEASSGCSCTYPVHSTMAFAPVDSRAVAERAARAPLRKPPVHRYRFAGKGGDRMSLLGGPEGHGVLRTGGGPSRLNGKGQMVLDGDPRSKGAGILSRRTLVGRASATVEVWFTPLSDVYEWTPVFRFGCGGRKPDYFAYLLRTATTHRAEICWLGHNEDIQVRVPMKVGTPMHIVMTYEANAGGDGVGELRYYRDGKLIGKMGTKIRLSALRIEDAVIGNAKGLYDEFRIYDYALSLAEVMGNYKAGPDELRVAEADKSR